MPRILGNFVGYFYTDFGQLNQVVHIWGYDSHEERRRRRAELQASPDFQPYLEKALPLVQRQGKPASRAGTLFTAQIGGAWRVGR